MNNNTETTTDVYALVNAKIMTLLEAGTIPWRKPWTEKGLPQNLISKRPYRGINLMLLNSLDYTTNQFLTWKQIKTISGSVKSGEKAHMVVFTKIMEQEKPDGTKEKKSILRYYWVFNVQQCKDIPKAFFAPDEASFEQKFEPLATCAAIIENMKDAPKIQHKKQEAYYSPALDLINLPKPASFKSSEEYYCTLFHELVHATGHTKRLNRKEVSENPKFGSEPYSNEELVAEMGACYLNAFTGIPNATLSNSAAYIQHWLGVLQHDKRFVIRAASRSQQAVEYILHKGSDTTDELEELSEGVLG